VLIEAQLVLFVRRNAVRPIPAQLGLQQQRIAFHGSATNIAMPMHQQDIAELTAIRSVTSPVEQDFRPLMAKH
jgi:hypothetical protein